MRRHRQRIAHTLAATALAGGCGVFTGPRTVDEPALIIYFGDTAQIAASDTVSPGAAFEVRVQTFAGGCTRAIARTEVRVAAGVVEVRPYNRRREAGACPEDLIYLEHRAEVRLDDPGAATIRVVGERADASSGARNAPAELTRQLVVH